MPLRAQTGEPSREPSREPTGDPVGELLAAIAHRLRGPGRLRRDLLAELADGLEDAAVAHAQRGLTVAQARALAAQEFGDPALVSAECQGELTAVQARRTAVAICLLVPLVDQLWSWWYPGLAGRPAARAAPRLDLFAVLPALQSVLVWLLAGAALHQLVLLRRGQRLSASYGVAVVASAVVLLVGGSSVLMMVFDDGATARVLAGSLQGWLLGLVSAGMLAVTGRLAWRSTVLTRHARRCGGTAGPAA